MQPTPEPINIRADLLATAVRFLEDPQVQSAPLSRRLAFLEGKGLTRAEIDLALARARTDAPQPMGVARKRPQGAWPGVALLAVLAAASLAALNYKSITVRAGAPLMCSLRRPRPRRCWRACGRRCSAVGRPDGWRSWRRSCRSCGGSLWS